MHVRTIITNELNTPIIWDCFRGSYTKLMYTVAHLIECVVNVSIEDGVTPQITLIFKLYNTNGFQQSTRKVEGGSIFSLEYSVKDIKDETLIEYFQRFYNDYVYKD